MEFTFTEALPWLVAAVGAGLIVGSIVAVLSYVGQRRS